MLNSGTLYFWCCVTAILLCLGSVTLAANRCVWTVGQVVCKNNRTTLNTEVRMYDKDGWGPFDPIDEDDLMGLTFPDEKGHFKMEGCGNDFDWFWITNNPEPYFHFYHYCNDEKNGEEARFPVFEVFVPETYRPPKFVLGD